MRILECGGKRSATPLWIEVAKQAVVKNKGSYKSKAASRFACRRTPNYESSSSSSTFIAARTFPETSSKGNPWRSK